MFNSDDGGWLSICLKNRRNRAKENDESDQVQNNEDENIDAQSGVNYLKKVVVNEANMPEIKQKLIETLDHRLKMLEALEIDLRTEFPYFFTHPQLVSIVKYNNCFLYRELN